MHSGHLFLQQNYSFLKWQKTSELSVSTLHWLIFPIKQDVTSEIWKHSHMFCQLPASGTAAAVGNLMWGSYQSSHSIIFLLPLAPLAGFSSFPVASSSKAGPGCPTQAAEESVSDVITEKFFWHISGDCTRYAILCNTSSDTSVWWERQNLASSSTSKRLKSTVRSRTVLTMEKKRV